MSGLSKPSLLVLLQSVSDLAVFDSLHNRDFRWFWLARLAASASMEMGTVAQGWLVYEITGSALALSWVSSARNVAIITNQTLIQAACTDQYCGRIMSMYMVTIGLLPLGTIPAGAMADVWGVPVALMAQGGLITAILGLLWLSRSRVRELR